MGSEEESTEESEEESSGEEESGDSDDELEEVDPSELGEEGTRGLSDILSAVGVNVGGQNKVLRDADGNPVQPVYTEDGQLATPTLTDQEGNVIHKGMSTGQKVALGAGAAALLGTAAVAATAVGVHYYRKKDKEGGKDKKKKGKKGKKDKKDKKHKKDKKDKKGKKTKRRKRRAVPNPRKKTLNPKRNPPKSLKRSLLERKNLETV